MNEVRTETTVGQLMTAEPISVSVDTPLGEVAETLARYRISGVPVLAEDGTLAGVISQTDLLRARTIEYLWSSWPGLRARHLMSHPALTVRPETTASEAARLMEQHGVHRLVVISAETHRPIGVMSVSDLLTLLAGHHD
jgi:CBS domain-containing protein